MRFNPHNASRAQLALAIALMITPIDHVLAHGFAGERFFPATILTDDPLVADEMSLPQVSLYPPGLDGSQETDIQIDLSKRVTPDTDFTIRMNGDVCEHQAFRRSAGWAHCRPARSTSFSSTDRTRRWASSGST